MQLHFEDSSEPLGETGGTNYRPDGTPTKVGLWMQMVQQRCLSYLPGNNMSYDEGTACYNGKNTKMKHRQSRYKPYDGIRVYMLNDSVTGTYLYLFIVAFVLCLFAFVYLFIVRLTANVPYISYFILDLVTFPFNIFSAG